MSILGLGIQNQTKKLIQEKSNIEQYREFFERETRNLFNKNTVEDGRSFNSLGEEVSLAGHFLSDYIPVNYNISKNVYLRYNYRAVLYDDLKNKIGDVIESTNLITISNNTKYIRVSAANSTLENQQVEYGTAFSFYEPYSNKVVLRDNVGSWLKESNAVDLGDNLFDKNKATANVSLTPSGSTTPLSGYITSDYIPVNAGVYPTISISIRNSASILSSVYRLIFFDKYLKPIPDSYATNVSITSAISIPSKAFYLKITTATHVNGYDMVVNYTNKFKGFWGLLFTKPTMLTQNNDDNKGNLLSRDKIIYNFMIDSSGQIIPSITSACTQLIPVSSNKSYYIHYPKWNDYNGRIYEYDAQMNFIGAYYPKFIHTPQKTCAYVAFNFMINNVKYEHDDFFGMISTEDWSGEIGEKISDDGKVSAYLGGKGFPVDNVFVSGVYENHVVVQQSNSSEFYYSAAGWRGPFIPIEFTSDNFPGLLSGSLVSQVVFFTTNAGIRCLVFMNKNQAYCSTTGAFSGFEIPDVWDLKGNKHWRIDESDKDPTGERYRKYFPTYNSETGQNKYGWHNGPVWLSGIGGQYSRGLSFANYTDTYSTTTALPSCLFYTEDGKNIYVQYEFGVYQKKYKLSDDLVNVKNSVNYNLGDDVDTTSLGVYVSGLSLRQRYNILPSASVPDPINIFEYSEPIVISSISAKNFTLEDASSISVGDTIIIEGSTGNDLDRLVNSTATETNGGTSVFIVKSKSGNVITLADSIGNSKNNLMCRHIHGVQEFGNGLILYTGEGYPESWMIYVNPDQRHIDDGLNMNRSTWFSDTVRLNSSKNAHQRALGIYLRSDKKIVFVADSNSPNVTRLTIRGQELKMGNYGVHVVDINDIDDASNSISKIQALNAVYALYYLSGLLILSDYRGDTYYSDDEGETWKHICKAGDTKSLIVGFDKGRKRYFFNNERGKVFVINIK